MPSPMMAEIAERWMFILLPLFPMGSNPQDLRRSPIARTAGIVGRRVSTQPTI
jgi:hypothetical protein